MPAILADNFNDNVIDSAKWDVGAIADQNLSVTVVETGAQLVITLLSSTVGSNRNGLLSDSTFNLTKGFAAWKLTQAASNGAVSRCGVYLDTNNYCSFEIASTTITFRKRDAGSNSDTSTTYNSTNHKYLALHRVGTVWNWYTSPDGGTWTSQRTGVTSTFAVTALKKFFDAGTIASVATPGTAIFDDVEIGILDIIAPCEQLAAFGGKKLFTPDPGFPMNVDIEGVQGEPFTIPMAKQRVGARITAAQTLIRYKATCDGEIDTLDIGLGSVNSSATSAIFNLEINGSPVFAGGARPTITTGQDHVQKTSVGAAVELWDDIEITIEQVPAEGVSGTVDTNARVVVS